MSDELFATLSFLLAVIGFLKPREISLARLFQAASRPPILVWSDAYWNNATASRQAVGGMGFVVFFPPGHPRVAGHPRGRYFYAARRVSISDLPQLERDSDIIGQLELLAAASPYVSFPDAPFDDEDVIHFIDNVSALYRLVKGFSSRPDSLAIIRAFHVANIAIRANVWFNYVATKANVADLPSRLAIGEMADVLRSFDPSFDLIGDRVDLVIPACPRDMSAMWAAVAQQLPGRSAKPARHSSRRNGSSGSKRRR